MLPRLHPSCELMRSHDFQDDFLRDWHQAWSVQAWWGFSPAGGNNLSHRVIWGSKRRSGSFQASSSTVSCQSKPYGHPRFKGWWSKLVAIADYLESSPQIILFTKTKQEILTFYTCLLYSKGINKNTLTMSAVVLCKEPGGILGPVSHAVPAPTGQPLPLCESRWGQSVSKWIQ